SGPETALTSALRSARDAEALADVRADRVDEVTLQTLRDQDGRHLTPVACGRHAAGANPFVKAPLGGKCPSVDPPLARSTLHAPSSLRSSSQSCPTSRRSVSVAGISTTGTPTSSPLPGPKLRENA